MKTYFTSILIDDLEQQTESFLQKAISELQMTAPSKLLQQPGKNKWSFCQCLEHLNSYGNYYLPAIANVIDIAEKKSWSAKEQFRPGWLGDYLQT